MTEPSKPVAERPAGSPPAAPAPPATRPMYWSMWRELWENRSIYIAPLVVAAFVMFGFMVSTIGLPHRRRATLTLDEAHQRAAIAQPYDAVAFFLIVTAFIVGVFYCLDALYGERRDRSILFWKSLPVSDRTTVLAKFVIPLVVLPLLTFTIIMTLQLMMLLWSTMVLLPSGLAATTWTRFNLFQQSLILLYGLIVIALWHAPIYGWLLLVSGWAKRAALLWAVFPLLAINIFEAIAFRSSHFASFLRYRLIGGVTEAFDFTAHRRGAIDSLTQLTPGRFLIAPGLWIGLAFTAACLATAMWLRRNREPI